MCGRAPPRRQISVNSFPGFIEGGFRTSSAGMAPQKLPWLVKPWVCVSQKVWISASGGCEGRGCSLVLAFFHSLAFSILVTSKPLLVLIPGYSQRFFMLNLPCFGDSFFPACTLTDVVSFLLYSVGGSPEPSWPRRTWVRTPLLNGRRVVCMQPTAESPCEQGRHWRA